jgi:transcriptional regulator with XRE-family HTH domain
MDVTRVFAENIKKLRRQRGLSQEALADLAGLHRTYIGAVERGERNITLLNANRIAEALEVELSECLRENK